MDRISRRRFLLDLLCAGGVVALAAGLATQAGAQPDSLKAKLDHAIDGAFKPGPRPKQTPLPLPQPPPVNHPAGAPLPQPPPRYPVPGRIARPPRGQ